jgi:hypothetical protein
MAAVAKNWRRVSPSSFFPEKPSGYSSGKNLVLSFPEANLGFEITSRRRATLCVTPRKPKKKKKID